MYYHLLIFFCFFCCIPGYISKGDSLFLFVRTQERSEDFYTSGVSCRERGITYSIEEDDEEEEEDEESEDDKLFMFEELSSFIILNFKDKK
jgi:hypothetical protein